MKKTLTIFEDLCTFVRKWSQKSNDDPEHIYELILEIDLAVNQLSAHANEIADYELLQLYLRLQNNLEILQETSPSLKQVKLLCAWPKQVRKFLLDRNNKQAIASLKTVLMDSNWPTECCESEYSFLQTPQSRLDQIAKEIGQTHTSFLGDEVDLEKKGVSSGYSSEQQELLDLINSEIAEIQESSKVLLADLNQSEPSFEKRTDILGTQIEQIDRIGSAAEMIGLHGLYLFCLYLQKILTFIQNENSYKLIPLKKQFLLWPDVLQAYLFAPNEMDYIQAALDYLSQECWPLKINTQELGEIETLFKRSIVETDSESIPDRLHKVTTEYISLEIPEDVSLDLVDSLLLDLNKQTQELSTAVQNLRNDDFLNQLEIAKRIAHTLKGAGNTVGIQGIANLTHNLEDILDALLKAKIKPNQILLVAIQNAADCLEEMSEYLHGIGPIPNNSEQILQEILNWANSIDECGVPQEDDVYTEVEALRPPEKLDATQASQENNQDENKTRDSVTEPSLRISASLVDDLLKRTGENIISNSQIQDLVLHSKEYMKLLSKNHSKVRALAQELENLIEIRGFSSRSSSRSNSGKFDPLELDQFNELHTFANQLMESTDDSIEFFSNIEESVLKLEKLSFNQVRTLRENQESVLRIRMIPVESIVPRLKRSVRQACKLSQKSAQLEVSGEQTLIDSEFLNQLVDPLMHLLRNAVDHGIELPEHRIRLNKNAEGKVKLSFSKEGSLIHVMCEDDGSGLDLNQIKSKGLEKNLVDKDGDFTKNHAIQMILQHGFSTKDKVTQLSGRGVGLDVVSINVREMKGTIKLDSTTGKGLKVELAIPTTHNSIHALVVSCGRSTFAISNRGVEEILYPGAGKIISISDNYYYEYKQSQYPIFDLQSVLNEKQIHDLDYNERAALIVHDDLNNKHAVLVDKISDTRDIVIKPFSHYIPKIAGLLGTTVLGDGSVTTVVDLIELLNTPNFNPVTSETHRQIQNTEESYHHVLIVEDAISTRKSLAQFMSDLGFEVKTAKDGVEAIHHMQKQLPAMVITDLEMPRMNGLELSDHLRTNKETANLPIIMITSRSTDKHKKEAERIGVTAYITKPFDEDQLLSLINSLGVAA